MSARIGSLLVGAGLFWNVLLLWKQTPERMPSWLGQFPLLMLRLKSLGQVAVGLTPGLWWTSIPGFPVLYLHLILLRFAPAAINPHVTRIGDVRVGGSAGAFPGALVLLLASLIPFTPMLP